MDVDVKLREKPLAPALLRELSVRSNLQGAIRTVSHYAAVLATGSLIWLVSSHYGLAWALPSSPSCSWPCTKLRTRRLSLRARSI